jgi:hypothetical protein
MYEVVIFSSEDTMVFLYKLFKFTMQIVEKLDPGHSIFSGYFGLESNVYDRGQYVKVNFIKIIIYSYNVYTYRKINRF